MSISLADASPGTKRKNVEEHVKCLIEKSYDDVHPYPNGSAKSLWAKSTRRTARRPYQSFRYKTFPHKSFHCISIEKFRSRFPSNQFEKHTKSFGFSDVVIDICELKT